MRGSIVEEIAFWGSFATILSLFSTFIYDGNCCIIVIRTLLYSNSLCILNKRKDNNMLDSRGVTYTEYNGRQYYNSSNAARYVGMTDTGLRRKRERLEKEYGIIIPVIILPDSHMKRYVDKRVLDVLRESIHVGEEDQWRERLKKVINEVNSGS
jgi:hypothetical protein